MLIAQSFMGKIDKSMFVESQGGTEGGGSTLQRGRVGGVSRNGNKKNSVRVGRVGSRRYGKTSTGPGNISGSGGHIGSANTVKVDGRANLTGQVQRQELPSERPEDKDTCRDLGKLSMESGSVLPFEFQTKQVKQDKGVPFLGGSTNAVKEKKNRIEAEQMAQYGLAMEEKSLSSGSGPRRREIRVDNFWISMNQGSKSRTKTVDYRPVQIVSGAEGQIKSSTPSLFSGHENMEDVEEVLIAGVGELENEDWHEVDAIDMEEEMLREGLQVKEEDEDSRASSPCILASLGSYRGKSRASSRRPSGSLVVVPNDVGAEMEGSREREEGSKLVRSDKIRTRHSSDKSSRAGRGRRTGRGARRPTMKEKRKSWKVPSKEALPDVFNDVTTALADITGEAGSAVMQKIPSFSRLVHPQPKRIINVPSPIQILPRVTPVGSFDSDLEALEARRSELETEIRSGARKGIEGLPQFDAFQRSPRSVGSGFDTSPRFPTREDRMDEDNSEGPDSPSPDRSKHREVLSIGDNVRQPTPVPAVHVHKPSSGSEQVEEHSGPQISPFSSFSGLFVDWMPLSPRSSIPTPADSGRCRNPTPSGAVGQINGPSDDDPQDQVWPSAGTWRKEYRQSLPAPVVTGRRRSSINMQYEGRDRFLSMPAPAPASKVDVNKGRYLDSPIVEAEGSDSAPSVHFKNSFGETGSSDSPRSPSSPATPLSPVTEMILQTSHLDLLTGGAFPIMQDMPNPFAYTHQHGSSSQTEFNPYADLGDRMTRETQADWTGHFADNKTADRSGEKMKRRGSKHPRVKHPFALFEGGSSCASTPTPNSLSMTRLKRSSSGSHRRPDAEAHPAMHHQSSLETIAYHPFAASKHVEHRQARDSVLLGESATGVLADFVTMIPTTMETQRPGSRRISEWPEIEPMMHSRRQSRESIVRALYTDEQARMRKTQDGPYPNLASASPYPNLTPGSDGLEERPVKTGYDGKVSAGPLSGSVFILT